MFVKRVVGLGGEKLEIRNKQVFINDKQIEEPYKRHTDPKISTGRDAKRDNLGPVTIPNGYVFAIGDNRDYSVDCRQFGFVPFSDLEGKAVSIYWSKDLSRIGSLK